MTDLKPFIDQASANIRTRYAKWGVPIEDVTQEMWLWALGEGANRITRWLTSDPPQTTRVARSLEQRAVQFAEREKAARVGYDSTDVFFYTASMVAAILPLALDDDYDGLHGAGDSEGRSGTPISEGGDLLAKVMDVRRAITALEWVDAPLRLSEPGVPDYEDAVKAVVDYLGGSHAIGRRQVVSNSRAQTQTSEDYQ